MAIMVKKLYRNGTFLYKMNLIAGREGLNNLVQWVHIIEDDAVTPYLHGNELVFTAGILNRRPDWLLNFAQKLHDAHASAFVVNLGPHTHEIPQDVIRYCDEVELPLFTIPWETKMVDMTRDFCYRIMRDEQTESNAVSVLKNIIFGVGDPEAQAAQMERYGYSRDSRFCFVSVALDGDCAGDPEENRDVLAHIAEKTAKSKHELFISFPYQEQTILILTDYEDGEIGWFITELTEQARRQMPGLGMHIGVSSNQAGIYSQSGNFEKALAAAEMATRRGGPICFYEQLGIYKLLYSVGDRTVLRGFYNDTIGRLLKYDQENHTNLAELLRVYLDSNGSLQAAAERQFVHRNTVTNQLKKIESITGYNPLDLQDKIMLSMGFYAGDIL